MSDRWESYPQWKQWTLIATSWPILITARVLWQYNPGIWCCLLFWVIALADDPLRWSEMRGRRRTLYGFAFLGGIGNAVATIANGGYMPVLRGFMDADRIAMAAKGESLWVPMTDSSRVQWLCDVLPGGSSIGDWCIGFALVGLLLNWLAEKAHLLTPEPEVDGKRLPGMGIG